MHNKLNTLNREVPSQAARFENGVQIDLNSLYASEDRKPYEEVAGSKLETVKRPLTPEMLKRNDIGQAAVNVVVLRDALLKQKDFYPNDLLTEADIKRENFDLAK